MLPGRSSNELASHGSSQSCGTPSTSARTTERTITSEGRAHVEALVSVLRERGLSARVLPGGAVLAENRALPPTVGDQVAQSLSPGLRQEVLCAALGGDGALWWHWVWSGPTRDAPAEVEPMLPVSNLTAVADRIVAVLALLPEGVS